ncbi:MAG: HDOD domain-containing protein [Bacteroidales bacterium]|nr:HDOD domain-containing protein [Candidatus Latescibacterota bacterium]
MKRREEILKRLKKINAIPGAGVTVINLLQNPDFDVNDLISRIEFDASLTSNVLRMANSSMYGYSGTTGSLKEAVVRLGANNIYKMVVASVVAPVARQSIRGYDLPAGELWLHAASTAVGIEKIALHMNIKLPNYAFTAGILHDIGKIAIGTLLEVDDEPIRFLLRRKRYSFEVAEEKVLGINHAEAGAILLKSWNFPEEIVDAVRWHHEPSKASGDSTVVELLHLADSFSMMGGFGNGKDGLYYKLDSDVFEKYGIKNNKAEEIIASITLALEELKDCYEIDFSLGGKTDVTECSSC